MKSTLFCLRSTIVATSILLTLMVAQTLGITWEDITQEKLVSGAELVIIGEVEEIQSRWNAERTRIYSFVTVKVMRELKGSSPEDKLTIRVRGGTVGNMSVRPTYVPSFEIGETILVLLRHRGDKRTFYIPGHKMGKFTIRNDRIVENGMSVDEFINNGLSDGNDRRRAKILNNEFTIIGGSWYWDETDLPIEYKINPNDAKYPNGDAIPEDSLEAAVGRAFQTWEDVVILSSHLTLMVLSITKKT